MTKADFDAKLQSLNKKINSNKTKLLLVENEIKKLNNFDAAYFRGKSYFDDDGTQNYLVFQLLYKYFERMGNEVSLWVSKGLSNEKISSVSNSYRAVPKIVYDNVRIKVKFNGNPLKQNKVTYNHVSIVNIYVAYRLTPKINLGGIGPTLQNFLFGAVKLTKNTDIDKYKFSGYGTGFNSRGSFTHPSGGDGKNVIIFEADLSSSTHGIDGTIIYAEKMYSTNFTVDNKKFSLSLHYNGDNSSLFINGK